jgi:uncharacterized membrane protein YphA (DoxX/SURF4 family)
MPAVGNARRSGAAVALLLVQLVVGYEWLVSGAAKIVNGDFPGGLAGALAELAQTSPAWYAGFLTGTVAPHAEAFGYAIETAELLAGLVLVGAAVAALRGGRPHRVAEAATTAALLVGLVLATCFELANGGTFGTRLAADSFDEGVDLDTVVVALQLALLVPRLALRRRPGTDGIGLPAGARMPAR